MPDMESVAAARKGVAAAYKTWLKESYETQLSEIGSKKTRHQLPEISALGAWANIAAQNKPLAWIIEFSRAANGIWKAGVPSSSYPNRIGSLNSRSPLQGVVTRVLPVFRTSDAPRVTEMHPYWEWAMIFVFPGLPLFLTRGNSSSVIEFDPATGRLWSPVDDEQIDQPYVDSALFKLVPDGEPWSAAVAMTYGEATLALSDFIHVMNAAPPEPAAGAEEEDDDDIPEPNASAGQNLSRSQTMKHRMSRADPSKLVLMGSVAEILRSSGSDVSEIQNKEYYAYRRSKNFATLEIYPRTGIKLYLKVDLKSIKLEPGFTRDMTGLGHFGQVGDLEVLIKSDADLEKAAALIARAYSEAS